MGTQVATTNNSNTPQNNTHSEIAIISEEQKVYGEITIADIKQSKIGTQNRDVLLAKFSENKIMDLDANIAGEKLRELINLAIFESGFKTENIPEIIITVIKDVFSDFGHLTLSEVSFAFRKGIRKEYGEFMGMSVITFYGWLKGYCETTRIEAIKALNLIKKNVEKVVTPQEKKVYHIKWLKARIEDFERHKKGEAIEVYDFGHLFYDYCIKHGVCYLSDEDKQKIKNSAVNNIVVEHSPDKARTSIEAKKFNDIIRDVQKEEITDDFTKTKVESEYKRLAIPYIYDKLIANGISLGQAITAIEVGFSMEESK